VPELSMGPKPFLLNEIKFTYQNCSLSAQHCTCIKRGGKNRIYSQCYNQQEVSDKQEELSTLFTGA